MKEKLKEALGTIALVPISILGFVIAFIYAVTYWVVDGIMHIFDRE